ncbi:hypothetical protein OIU78_026257 [Salix suchowensis]|nr:hypothetical protein OIU78_026257 [Salix suchowensis]
MCKRCGDLRMIACSGCKGTGLVKEGGALSFNFIDDMYESLGGDSTVKTIRCSKCQAREDSSHANLRHLNEDQKTFKANVTLNM